MAQKLLKDIHRETLAVTNMKGETQIVTLKAGGMLEFRSKGKHFRYAVPLAACYNMAIIYTAPQWYKDRLARYLEGKKEGCKLRWPKPLPKIFNQFLYEALKMK